MNTEPAHRNNDFDMNRPTIISLLYVASFLMGVTALIAVVLAYMWQGEASETWEKSHYRYHIRTFWMGLAWSFVALIGSILTLFLLAWILFPLVAVWMVARAIKSLMAAQKHQPIHNETTWIV